MAAGSEIKGSRQERKEGKMQYGTMLFVSDDNSTGVPVIGTSFFIPGGGTVESGPTGRRVVSIQTDPEALPGLYYHAARYAAFKAYA